MELGLAPDGDSLFEEATEKSRKPPCIQQSYCIKNCYPLVISIFALKIKDGHYFDFFWASYTVLLRRSYAITPT